MKIPKLFGLPLYVNMKRRVVNKYVKRFWGYSLKNSCWDSLDQHLGHLKVGDLFFGCGGYNQRIASIKSNYFGVGNGRVLVDAALVNDVGGSCSLKYCRPEVPKTQTQVEEFRQRVLINPKAREWNWDVTYSPEVMTVNLDGTVNINLELEKKLLSERK